MISKGQKTDNPLKDAFELLESKLTALPEDKAVLILNEVIRLIDNIPEPVEQKSDDMAVLFSQNIQSSVEAVITKELEDWIRNRLPQVFSETVSAQLEKTNITAKVQKNNDKDLS